MGVRRKKKDEYNNLVNSHFLTFRLFIREYKKKKKQNKAQQIGSEFFCFDYIQKYHSMIVLVIKKIFVFFTEHVFQLVDVERCENKNIIEFINMKSVEY